MKFCKMAEAAILDLFEPELAPLDLPSPKTPPRTKHEVDRTTGCGDRQLKFFHHARGRHLGFVRTVNSAVRRYASAGYRDRNVSVCPSVRHAPVLCQNEES